MTEVAARPIYEKEAADYRATYPIFEHTTYLNSCSLGPLSQKAIEALDEYRQDYVQWGAPAWWRLWLPKLEEAKERFARLIGAQPHEVTISHSVSSALSSIASTFDYRKRPAVACAQLDFPTIPYQWLAREIDGVQVRFAATPDGIRVPMDAWEGVADERVELVATSHVFYTSGAIQPVRELADLAHAHGARIVIDGYHSVGVFPIDVKALDVDFYIGGTLKWLLGGPGLTFIYVREDLIPTLHPRISGWFSSADQFAFDAQHLEWPATADRLELGTPAVATAYTGVAGMDAILEADPIRIYGRIQMLTDLVVERARISGYAIVSPERAEERAGIVMLRVAEPRQTVAELANRGFTIDYRPGLVRISPHFYNTVEDVDRFMDALDQVQGALKAGS